MFLGGWVSTRAGEKASSLPEDAGPADGPGQGRSGERRVDPAVLADGVPLICLLCFTFSARPFWAYKAWLVRPALVICI